MTPDILFLIAMFNPGNSVVLSHRSTFRSRTELIIGDPWRALDNSTMGKELPVDVRISEISDNSSCAIIEMEIPFEDGIDERTLLQRRRLDQQRKVDMMERGWGRE